MKIDLSVVPSYECNLTCWFCMYDCGPDKKEEINLFDLARWLGSVNWEMINWTGVYGGEPAVNILLYETVLNMFPKDKPKFTISNGAWTKDKYKMLEFLSFISRNKLYCKVSSTPEHLKAQDLKAISILHNWRIIEHKVNDDTKATLLPMGRLKHRAKEFKCKLECLTWQGAYRVAVRPEGNIIFQSCKGIYPVVSDITKPFSHAVEMIEKKLESIRTEGGCFGR